MPSTRTTTQTKSAKTDLQKSDLDNGDNNDQEKDFGGDFSDAADNEYEDEEEDYDNDSSFDYS